MGDNVKETHTRTHIMYRERVCVGEEGRENVSWSHFSSTSNVYAEGKKVLVEIFIQKF